MEPFQVAVLTLGALAVGILIPVMIQLWLALRQMQQDMREARALIGPVLGDIRGVTQQLRNNAQVTSAIAVAVSAGVQAWVKSRQDATSNSPQTEEPS